MSWPDAVWLVVLNWNGREDTLELLNGLTAEPATILVVDNGSFDGTLEAVHARFPAVLTLQVEENLGYAGGNNAGISYALEHGAEIVGVLNNDTIVYPGFLEPLVAQIRGDRRIAVSPDIRYADEPSVSWFRGSFIDRRTGWPQHLPPDRQPSPMGDPFDSPVLTGCCLVAASSVWREVGLFDDGMFLIFEDSDWSRRAVAAGISLLVVPESRIQHKVSRSFTGLSGLLSSYYFARNGTVFVARHFGRGLSFRFLVRVVLVPQMRRCLTSRSARIRKLLALWGALDAIRGRRGAADARVVSIAHRATVVPSGIIST